MSAIKTIDNRTEKFLPAGNVNHATHHRIGTIDEVNEHAPQAIRTFLLGVCLESPHSRVDWLKLIQLRFVAGQFGLQGLFSVLCLVKLEHALLDLLCHVLLRLVSLLDITLSLLYLLLSVSIFDLVFLDALTQLSHMLGH